MPKGGWQRGETEKAYPIPAKDGNGCYLFTECDNRWYSIEKDPMWRDNCICPKCGKTIKVVMLKEELVV